MFRRKLLLSAAKHYAAARSKKLLHINCGDAPLGDVNADTTPRDVPNFILIEPGQPLPFSDKEFGAIFSEKTIESSPSPLELMQEFDRIADRVFVVIPMVWDVSFFRPSNLWLPANLSATTWIENPLAKILAPIKSNHIADTIDPPKEPSSIPIQDASDPPNEPSPLQSLMGTLQNFASTLKTKITDFLATLPSEDDSPLSSR